jgi:DNA-binding NtrC family response regulator
VDDEPLIREMLSRLLGRANYVVHLASDAETALRVMTTTCVGTILVDRNLPTQNGDQLVEEVRNRFPTTAVILATGEYVPPHLPVNKLIVGFLAKPFTNDTVLRAVADAMAWHRVAEANRGAQM